MAILSSISRLRMFRASLILFLAARNIFAGAGQPIDEYQLKAVFLYNFARFVQWPSEAFQSPNDPIAICILGENPFGNSLGQAVDGKAIEQRKFTIRQIAEPRQAAGCQILFVSSSEQKHLRGILAEIRTPGTLIVGDSDRFAEEGGVANLKLEGDHIRIQVNVAAAERAKLQISSRLLSLAQIVRK